MAQQFHSLLIDLSGKKSELEKKKKKRKKIKRNTKEFVCLKQWKKKRRSNCTIEAKISLPDSSSNQLGFVCSTA
jgi:hypothetical protein